MAARTSRPTFAAVLVMAGSGVRFGGPVPKTFLPLDGRPMWRHAADLFASMKACRAVVLVVPERRVQAVRTEMPGALVVRGGLRRQDSVRHGIAVVPPGVDVVAIHDAARPLLRAETVTAVVAEAAKSGAALAAIPVRDTIKRVSEGRIVETLDRSALWSAQTPQAFRLELIRRAHEAAVREGWEVTDDCALVERLGEAVAVVRGDPWNLKVTERDDLALAEAVLRSRSGARAEETP